MEDYVCANPLTTDLYKKRETTNFLSVIAMQAKAIVRCLSVFDGFDLLQCFKEVVTVGKKYGASSMCNVFDVAQRR